MKLLAKATNQRVSKGWISLAGRSIQCHGAPQRLLIVPEQGEIPHFKSRRV
jgi:hypothetical protein